jgi:di/tripeptidase
MINLISWRHYRESSEVPTIGFVSHFDTTPDFTGANVKPKLSHYDGILSYGAKYYFVP